MRGPYACSRTVLPRTGAGLTSSSYAQSFFQFPVAHTTFLRPSQQYACLGAWHGVVKMTVTKRGKRSRFAAFWQVLCKLLSNQLRPGLTLDVRTILGPYVGSIRGVTFSASHPPQLVRCAFPFSV
jgi:hypothetical protein